MTLLGCGTCQPRTAAQETVLSNPPSSSSSYLCQFQFSLGDTGDICCYKTSHFCPLEPWFGEHDMFLPVFGHEQQSQHLPHRSSSSACTWVQLCRVGSVPVNFWHSSGASLCSVSWNNAVLSWILDPRAAQPQSAVLCLSTGRCMPGTAHQVTPFNTCDYL